VLSRFRLRKRHCDNNGCSEAKVVKIDDPRASAFLSQFGLQPSSQTTLDRFSLKKSMPTSLFIVETNIIIICFF